MPRLRRRKIPSNSMTVQEVANLMGLSVNAVLYNIREKMLKGRFDGYRWWVTEEDYESWRAKYYRY